MRWDALQVMRSRAILDTAVLSACLVGSTSPDVDGDPMGLVSSLQLLNTRCAVGLVSVADGAMMWFSVLLHWHLSQGMAMRAALSATKQAFEHQQWPSGFLEFLDRNLTDSIQEALCPHPGNHPAAEI